MIIDQLRMLDETLTIETALSKGVTKDSPFLQYAPKENFENHSAKHS